MPTGRVLESAFEYHSTSRTSRTAHSLPRKSHFKHYSSSECLRVGSSSREDHRRDIAGGTFLSLKLVLYPRSTSGRISRFRFSKFLARECDRDRDETTNRDVPTTVGRCMLYSRMNRMYEGRKRKGERNVSEHEGSAREFAGRLKHSSAVSRPPHPKLDSSSSNESAVSVGSPSGIEGGLGAQRVGRRARRACAR